jgi:uncharacterized membrane protein YkoI
MKRTVLMVAAAGVVLAATGATIGVAASGASSPAQLTSLVADDSPSPAPSELFPSESHSPTPDQSSLDDSPAPAPANARISADRAAEIALARAGGRITDVEAEFEHGRPVWKVELVTGGVQYRVDVDRETGAIVRSQPEDGDRTARDDRPGDDHSGSGGRDGDSSGRDHPEDD